MQSQVWECLGLAGPTQDIRAIKSAYARRLRHTRPEDDPQAYQDLRAAYEAAQQWAALPAVAEEPGQPTERLAPAQAVATPIAAPAEYAAERLEEPLPELDLPALFNRLDQTWTLFGEQALWRAWAEVAAQLESAPLARQGEVSARMADWVLNHPSAPPGWLYQVAKQFGWLDDFRVQRLIGPERVQALQALYLDNVLPVQLSAETVDAFSPLTQALQAAQQGPRWLALLLAVMHGGRLGLLAGALDRRLFRGLGLAPETSERLAPLLRQAFWVRVSLLLALLGSTAALIGAEAETYLAQAGLCVLLFVGLGALEKGRISLLRMGQELQANRRMGAWWQRLCASEHAYRWGAGVWAAWVGLLVCTHHLQGEAQQGLALVALVSAPVVLLSSLLLWPAHPGHDLLSLAGALAGGLIIYGLAGQALGACACFGLGVLWSFTAARLLEQDHVGSAWGGWGRLFGLQAQVLQMSHHWGLRLALLPLGAVALAAAMTGQVLAWQLALTWLLTAVVLRAAQARLSQLALRFQPSAGHAPSPTA